MLPEILQVDLIPVKVSVRGADVVQGERVDLVLRGREKKEQRGVIMKSAVRKSREYL